MIYSSHQIIKYAARSPIRTRVKAPSEFRLGKIKFSSWNYLWFFPWWQKANLSANLIWAVGVQNPESYLLGLFIKYGPIFPVHSYGDRPPRKKSYLLNGCSLNNPTSGIVCELIVYKWV